MNVASVCFFLLLNILVHNSKAQKDYVNAIEHNKVVVEIILPEKVNETPLKDVGRVTIYIASRDGDDNKLKNTTEQYVASLAWNDGLRGAILHGFTDRVKVKVNDAERKVTLTFQPVRKTDAGKFWCEILDVKEGCSSPTHSRPPTLVVHPFDTCTDGNGIGQLNYKCVNDDHVNDDHCFPPEQMCDGVNNCQDQSDEKLRCDYWYCVDGYIKCNDNMQCRPQGSRCDGVYNCYHKEDEQGCSISHGSKCVEADSCAAGLLCVAGSCQCPDTKKFYYDGSICQTRVAQWGKCVEHRNCALGLMCRMRETGSCQCLDTRNTYYDGSSTCLQKITHGRLCDVTAKDSCVKDLLCSTTTKMCECPENTVYNGSLCQQKLDHKNGTRNATSEHNNTKSETSGPESPITGKPSGGKATDVDPGTTSRGPDTPSREPDTENEPNTAEKITEPTTDYSRIIIIISVIGGLCVLVGLAAAYLFIKRRRDNAEAEPDELNERQESKESLAPSVATASTELSVDSVIDYDENEGEYDEDDEDDVDYEK